MFGLAQQHPIAANAARQFRPGAVKRLAQIAGFDAQPVLEQGAQRLGAGVEILAVNHARI